jgi:hypothetical protein
VADSIADVEWCPRTAVWQGTVARGGATAKATQ